MFVWIKRGYLSLAILGLMFTGAALAQSEQGRSNGGSEAASAVGAGGAGQAVVLRPSGPVPGQFIIVFKDDVANPRGLANALARQNGLALRGVYTTALKGFAARMPEAVAERLALDPDVAYVEQDLYAHADGIVTGVDRIDAEQDTMFLSNPVNVDVAVIDTGIDPHSDLNWSDARFYNCIGGCASANAFDDNGHGTHVAGTIGAFNDGSDINSTEVVGVAPGANLWGFKVLDSKGSGSFADVIAAIDRVTELADAIDVVNMSLSGQGYLASLRTAVQNSVASGVVYVVAAGNSGRDVYGGNGQLDTAASCKGVFCRNADDTIPAAYPEVMAVSALADFDGMAGGVVSDANSTVGFSSCTHTGDDVFACFTNYSDHDPGTDNPLLSDGTTVLSSPGGAIDVAGPGVRILSTDQGGGYGWGSGTSMASPHVAGAVAMHIAANGGVADAAGVADIRQAMIDSAQAQTEWRADQATNDPDSMPEGLVYLGADLARDVAVISVTAPSPVLVGGSQTVSVDIANNGPDQESFDVILTDDLSATIDSPINVVVDGNSSTTVVFNWTPGVTGPHTLTGSHNLTDDLNGANDTASTTVSVSDPVTDAAVTSIDAPSPVEVGTTQTVTVGVINNSTQEEILTVSLADVQESTSTGSEQSTTLSAGGADTLTFSWTPTTTGDHDLTAAVSLTDDSNSNNNTMSTVSTVVEPGATAFVVDSVCYSGSGGKGSDKHLVSTVAITDGANAVVEATVDATVTDGTESRSATGTTDTVGEVQFAWKNATAGDTYTTTVDLVNGEAVDPLPNSVTWFDDPCFF
jgi:subtilisin family serine protease